jgi:cyclopropane-fatty-acyl-phospholipid synthase
MKMDATPVATAGDRQARMAVQTLLRRLDSGVVVVREAGRQERRFGPGGPDRYGRPGFEVEVRIHDPRAWRSVLTGASVGLGDAWSEGWWDCDDLPGLLRLLSRVTHRHDLARWAPIRQAGRAVDPLRRLRRQDPARDRAHIAAHYDLGNDFFALMLDPTMTYSGAVFARPEATLAQASTEKLERLCRLVGLEPGHRLVEIGTGWGSLAAHAATHHGARVTTTTLSAEQFGYARRRMVELGVADRVEVRHDDYRDLTGTFDRLVSIEMVEAVDWRELDTYFATCARLLTPDGLMGLQAIVIPGPRYEARRNGRDFVKARVFPGGCLHSIESISASLRRTGDLELVELHDYGLHYAETLRRWRANLAGHQAELDALGLDHRFRRQWDFYLCYCQAGFDERAITVVQALLARPGHRPPLPTPTP